MITLSDDFKKQLQFILQHFDAQANEATRTHKIIATILNYLEYTSNNSYNYVAAETNEDNKRPDFLIKHNKKEFFIIEAKANLSQKDHLRQINDYLNTHDLRHGCLTDGIQWAMLERDNSGELHQAVSLYATDPQAIFDYITSKV